MNRVEINLLKEKYKPGVRIKLIKMEDPYSPVEPGSTGSVRHVDDIGTIHMNWDQGGSLGLIPAEDSFEIIK